MVDQTLTRTGVRQWTIDEMHTDVGFSVRHLMITTVRGRFNSFAGTAEFDPGRIEDGSIEVEIETASIDTRDERRDNHLRSADFFDAEVYPTIRFTSRSVTPRGNGRYAITGDLEIHGTTRPVTLDAEFTDVITDPFGNARIGVSASTEIDRSEFGLTWNRAIESGGVTVSDHVKITIDAALVAS